MRVVLSTMIGRKTDTGFESFLFSPTPVPTERVEVDSITALKSEISRYEAIAEAAKAPMLVNVCQDPRDRTRKLNGFNAIADEQRFTAAALTATAADLEPYA